MASSFFTALVGVQNEPVLVDVATSTGHIYELVLLRAPTSTGHFADQYYFDFPFRKEVTNTHYTR